MANKTNTLITSIQDRISRTGSLYLVVGIINTFFGYFGTLLIYTLLRNSLNTISILVISKFITISFSYITYKFFVFKTSGNWLKEYCKCFISYGASSIVSIFIIFLMVDCMAIQFWIAQLLAILITVIFSFFSHNYFTFSTK